jgi:hypothetical protein
MRGASTGGGSAERARSIPRAGAHDASEGGTGEGKIRPTSRGVQCADAADQAGDADKSSASGLRSTSGGHRRGLSIQATEQEHYVYFNLSWVIRPNMSSHDYNDKTGVLSCFLHYFNVLLSYLFI